MTESRGLLAPAHNGVMSTNRQAEKPTNTVPAADLKPGDVIWIAKGTTGRVDRVEPGAKTVLVTFVYLTCAFAPNRIGDPWETRHRLTTQIAKLS